MSLKNIQTKKTSHSKYNINYHIVFCPKYCHNIFKDKLEYELSKFGGSGLWSRWYYISTAGTVSSETIQKYIQNQKNI